MVQVIGKVILTEFDARQRGAVAVQSALSGLNASDLMDRRPGPEIRSETFSLVRPGIFTYFCMHYRLPPVGYRL